VIIGDRFARCTDRVSRAHIAIAIAARGWASGAGTARLAHTPRARTRTIVRDTDELDWARIARITTSVHASIGAWSAVLHTRIVHRRIVVCIGEICVRLGARIAWEAVVIDHALLDQDSASRALTTDRRICAASETRLHAFRIRRARHLGSGHALALRDGPSVHGASIATALKRVGRVFLDERIERCVAPNAIERIGPCVLRVFHRATCEYP